MAGMTRTLVHGGSVFDPVSGEVGLADVTFEDGRIVAVGTGLDGDIAVDATGKTLLPGLFDCHTHVCMTDFDYLKMLSSPFSMQFFEAQQNLRTLLDLGITTIRDAWGADAGVKAAVDRGMIAGPRLRITISMVSQTGGHADDRMSCGAPIAILPAHPGRPDAIVDGVDAARLKVRELIRAGADGIKVAASGGVLSPNTNPHHPQLGEDELTMIVTEAAAAGRWVMAHCHSTAGAKNAIRAGVRSIDHGSYLDESAVAMMVERGTWLVPTLLAAQGVLNAIASGTAMPPGIAEKATEARDSAKTATRLAVEAGVPLALGTDCPVSPHGTNLEELALMAECGLTPAGALNAATLSAAKLLNLADELGSLEPGKRADLVVLTGDPFDFSGYADRVEQVWKDGDRVA